MEEVMLDLRGCAKSIQERFKNKDFVSLDEVIGSFEDALYEIECLEEEKKDLEDDIRDNYKPIPLSEMYGVSDRDFYVD